MAPDNSRTPAPTNPALKSTDNQQPTTHTAIVARDRDFRIHAETVGDVMRDFHEQLRLRGILRTLPPLAVAILWLMLDLLDEESLIVDNRLIVRVSHGYLHEHTGREAKTSKSKKSATKDEQNERRNTGHVARTIETMIDAGIIAVAAKGSGVTASTYELFIPKDTGDLLGRRSVSGRRCNAGATPNRALARGPENPLTRASAGTNSAPALHLVLRQRAVSPRASVTLAPIHYSGSAAAAAASEAAAEPDSRSAAVRLLVEDGVPELDALDILTDPTVRIADQLLCPTIERIKRERPGKKRNPGGFWRVALRNHHSYGADPVVQTVEQHRQRQPAPPLDNYAQLGRGLVEQMPDDQVIEAHVLLLEHFRRTGKSLAVEKLDDLGVDELRSSADFWKAVAKNQGMLGISHQGEPHV